MLEALKEEAEGAIDAEELEDVKKDIEEAAELLAKYEELGTPEELKDIKDKAEELVDELDKKEQNEAVERLVAKKYGLKVFYGWTHFRKWYEREHKYDTSISMEAK
jgi:ABC-type Fe3+-hydroxamate transport system substrate-binding protein